jgi:hypothetical protein
MKMIDVLLPGATEVTQMAEEDLLKLTGGFEDEREVTAWIQYHLPETGALVHRSAHVHLKEGSKANISAGQMG